jgi:ADP-ribosylglycohydrolase
VRRAVYERDGARCTYIDERGERCQETHYLELHHRQPFGMQGAHTTANLTLHCRAHNSLAAEVDFGRKQMTERQQSSRHESLASERRSATRTIDEPD